MWLSLLIESSMLTSTVGFIYLVCYAFLQLNTFSTSTYIRKGKCRPCPRLTLGDTFSAANLITAALYREKVSSTSTLYRKLYESIKSFLSSMSIVVANGDIK